MLKGKKVIGYMQRGDDCKTRTKKPPRERMIFAYYEDGLPEHQKNISDQEYSKLPENTGVPEAEAARIVDARHKEFMDETGRICGRY